MDEVAKCLRALEAASGDTEKLAAMFLVPKVLKSRDLDKAQRMDIMKAIGFSYIARMLRSRDSPDDGGGGECPRLMYQSVALSVLSCFTADFEIMTDASVIFNIPVMLDIIMDADNEIYEENLLIISDAYEVLAAIACSERGRAAFVSNRGVHALCLAHVGQSFQCERALDLLTRLAAAMGPACWDYHSGHEDFNSVMAKFCEDFVASSDADKFELCDTIRTIIRSFPKTCFGEDDPWLSGLQRGLRDILFSKISRAQRDPALKLVSAVVEASRDFEWCARLAEDDNKVSGGDPASKKEEAGKFVLVVINLSSIEVIMRLGEDKTLEAVAASKDSDLDLLVSCFLILESAVAYLASAEAEDGETMVLEGEEDKVRLRDILDAKQKSQMYSALNNAFTSVLKFLSTVSATHKSLVTREETVNEEDFVRRNRVLIATVRVLCSWLAEETSASRDEVCALAPFLLTIATDTHAEAKAEKLKALPPTSDRCGDSESFQMSSAAATEWPPDVLRFLMPALCHLVAEDKARAALKAQFDLTKMLHNYLEFQWTVFDACRSWADKQESLRSKSSSSEQDSSEPAYAVDNARFEATSSRYALVTACNVLMNVVVLEPELIRSSKDDRTFKFIVKNLPNLTNAEEQLVLYGNLSVLGLLIMKNKSIAPDGSIFKFMQSVVRFLWDAHNCEDSPADAEVQLGVSFAYVERWNDLEQLWFLGMQILNSLMKPLPWIAEFVVDCGWCSDVVNIFNEIDKGQVNPSVLAAHEDLLCCVAKSGEKSSMDELKKCGAVEAANKHGMRDLQKELLTAKS